MADLYGLGLSGVPLEYSSQIRALQQQQMMANSLLQQGLDPVQNSGPPGSAISPTQGLAKMVQAYVGAKAMQNMNKGYADIGNKFNADQSAAVDKVSKAIAPQPATPIPLANANGIEGQMIPRTPQEKQAAVQEAMLSQFPNVRQFGTALNNNIQADIARDDNQQFRMDTLKAQQDQRAHERALADEERLRQEAVEKVARAERFEQNKILKGMGGGQQSPYFQPVQTGQGVFAFNARTGRVEPVTGPDGKPIVGAVADPALQGQIAGAKTAGGAEAKREFNMTGLGDTIQEAKSILSGQDGALPTGSGVGVARDAIGGFFGVSTDGALQAQKLKALSGALTSKMPRMEGPQSDKDVLMYREMAAEIGNASVPVARRKAALDTVEKLWAKYEPGNKTKPAPAVSVESLLEKYK